MKLLFRINYRTQWGEQLYVVGNIPELGDGDASKALAMNFSHDEEWWLELDITASKAKKLEYQYVLKNHNEGTITKEWGDARKVVTKTGVDTVLLIDAWNSVSAVENTFMTAPFVDVLLKEFRYEKEEAYEDAGRYVHRLLGTGSNTSRNFLQAYVRDDRVTIVKSYYYGSVSMCQQSLSLRSNDEEGSFSGSNHAFELEGWHEIMTLEDESALRLLNFVSAHITDRIRVKGVGDKDHKTWVYYLNDKEKESLSKTYELGWLMKDIKVAEDIRNKSYRQIERYESNH